MSYNKNKIYIDIPSSLTGKERKRYIANERHLINEKARKLRELEHELAKQAVRLLEDEVLKKQEALKYKQHVVNERSKLGLQ